MSASLWASHFWRRAFAGESLAEFSDQESARLIPYFYAVMLHMENTYNQFFEKRFELEPPPGLE
jgi:hypothetical protein